MSKNMTDIHLAAIEVNGCDQPVFVSADVEDDPMIQLVGGREDLSQFGKAIEFCFLHDLEPTR
jgi:hypothetical protein